MTWIAPEVDRSEDYPARRNEPEREMLLDWLDWHARHNGHADLIREAIDGLTGC